MARTIERHDAAAGGISRSETANVRARSFLYDILRCIHAWDLSRLLYEKRRSVYEVARAFPDSGIPRPQVIDWLHMFAGWPNSPCSVGSRSAHWSYSFPGVLHNTMDYQ